MNDHAAQVCPLIIVFLRSQIFLSRSVGESIKIPIRFLQAPLFVNAFVLIPTGLMISFFAILTDSVRSLRSYIALLYFIFFLIFNFITLVVSASSDHTVHVWSPHDTHASMVATPLGHHNDYVKCLASCRDQNWVASGAFDKQIKIWDLAEGRLGPVYELPEPLKHSIYSLAVNPSGTVLAAGSPERVVRTWDPRSGKKLTSKLAGHTDNIRCLLVSEDGRKVCFISIYCTWLA